MKNFHPIRHDLIPEGKKPHLENIAQFKNISPVAWQHINLHGRYEFTKAQDIIDMREIIQEMLKGAISDKIGA